MRFKIHFLLLLGLLIFISCQQEVTLTDTYSIPPKPDVWQVGFSPGTQWIEVRLASCSGSAGNTSVLPVSYSEAQLSDNQNLLYFQWGDQGDVGDDRFIWQAEEKLLVITHPDVPIRFLTSAEFQRVFSENLANWNDINPYSSFACELTMWGYPPGSDLENNLASLVPGSQSRLYVLSSDPAAMVKAVSKTPCSIGFIPESALSDSVEVIEVDVLQNSFPILMTYSGDKSADIQNWFGCLQQADPSGE